MYDRHHPTKTSIASLMPHVPTEAQGPACHSPMALSHSCSSPPNNLAGIRSLFKTPDYLGEHLTPAYIFPGSSPVAGCCSLSSAMNWGFSVNKVIIQTHATSCSHLPVIPSFTWTPTASAHLLNWIPLYTNTCRKHPGSQDGYYRMCFLPFPAGPVLQTGRFLQPCLPVPNIPNVLSFPTHPC